MSRRSLALRAGLLLLLAACGGPEPEPPPAPVTGERYTVLIRNGKVVDGTGNAWFRGDVGILGDRILRVAPAGGLDPERADRVVDATGLVVAPGFIDIQGQSDRRFLRDGRALSKLLQGVTTEILGEGGTPAPIHRGMVDDPEAADSVLRRRLDEWRSFAGWLEEVEDRGVAVNVASFLGASTVREYAMGMEDREPTAAELDTMRAVVRRAMDDGALGVASALIYPPGAYASTDELVEIARVAGRAGGIYVTHLRSEGDRLLEALDEAMEIGERSGAPVEIYHLKAAGKRNWEKGPAAVAKIDSARGAGLDVGADMYPYTAASTGLTACLPPWTAAGGELMETLADEEARERIRAEVAADEGEWENWCLLAGPGGSMIVGVDEEENEGLEGLTLAELADRTGKGWLDAAMDLILDEEGGVSMVYFAMSEENLRMQLRRPWMKFATDASAWAPDSAESMTHPRSYGTYPRILGRYVREEGVLPLEEAVRKMTSAVADRVGLRGRGQIRRGFSADIVVFDEEEIAEEATFTEPHRLATGVRWLFVNGRDVIREGRYTGALPGKFLRKPERWRRSPGAGDDAPAEEDPG